MAEHFRATRAEHDYVMDQVDQAGQQFRSGDQDGAQRTLRHAIAETVTPEFRDVLDNVAEAARWYGQ